MSNLENFVNVMCEYVVAGTAKKRVEAVEKLKQMMAEQNHIRNDVEGIVRDMFLEIGVPDHLIGYDYAVDAIVMSVSDRKLSHNTCELYRVISDKYDQTACKVERGIRHLVEETMERGNMEQIQKYFGKYISSKTGKVTNGEFIARMANMVRKKMREA